MTFPANCLPKTKNCYHKGNQLIDVIKEHLSHVIEASFNKADETINANNLKLGVHGKYHQKICKMLRKNNQLWSDLLANVNITQHRIYLIPGARPLKSAPHRAGPKPANSKSSK